MIDNRLYRTAWLVAGVALLAALLTLRSPSTPPSAQVSPAFDPSRTVQLGGELAAVAPSRPPGSAVAADWIATQLGAIPGVGRRTVRQRFAVRADGQTIEGSNVFTTVPPIAPTRSQRNLLVVAPRDTPAGISGQTGDTALLVELARAATATPHHHAIVFLSTDAGTLGNAGIRWFLRRFSRGRVAGAVLLDRAAEGRGSQVQLWVDGGGRQGQAIRDMAAAAVRRAGGHGSSPPSLPAQLLRLSVPQTFGEQGPLVAAGIPAVTLSARRESPPRAAPALGPARAGLVGASAQGLLDSLDAVERAPAPDGALAFGGKLLRPTVVRMGLLLLVLPLLVAAVDATRRRRRGSARLGPGMRLLFWRAAPALVALLVAHLLALFRVLPPAVAGRAPLPVDMGFDGLSGLGLVLTALVFLAVWGATRRRVVAAAAAPAATFAAALLWLAALALVAWYAMPFALVLLLPAAHAALVATMARRRWQLAALALVAVLPLLALVVVIAQGIHRGLPFAAWYLLETSASGARGLLGPILAVLAATATVTLAGLALARSKKSVRSSSAGAGPAPPAPRRAPAR